MNEISQAVREELSLLTPDQVCELLQVKKDWLYDMVEKKNFPVVRLGRRQLRFRPAEVAEWVAGDRPTPEPTPAPNRPVRRRPRQ